MSRIARIIVPGFPHHITQRGNNRQDVFRSDDDRAFYLNLLRPRCTQYGVKIWAYCLMNNHVHFVAVPEREDSFSILFRELHSTYTNRFNDHYNTSGHLRQSRFYSSPMDDAHAWAAVRYVERNPVRAGLAANAHDFPWSSAPAHCGQRPDPLLSEDFPPPGAIPDWSAWLTSPDDPQFLRNLRCRTQTGRPCGSPAFINQLEHQLGKSLRPQKPGPKPKKFGD